MQIDRRSEAWEPWYSKLPSACRICAKTLGNTRLTLLIGEKWIAVHRNAACRTFLSFLRKQRAPITHLNDRSQGGTAQASHMHSIVHTTGGNTAV